MKICLTANSGGHLNQLLQLQPFYTNYEYFFITNRTGFSEELSRTAKVYFVEKFIMKEIISKFQLFKPLKNLLQSIIPLIREKPDLIITTGAGVSLGACIIGKVIRSRIVFIESIARTSTPSSFGKVIKHLADKTYVQWPELQKYYKDSEYAGIIFNFNEIKNNPFPSNEIRKILVTFGTYKLQFNRILKELDSLIESGNLKAEIIAQIGHSDYKPKHFEHFDYCAQSRMHSLISESDLVICQGGSGSIMDSLMRGKKVIAVPRMMVFGEFFDDHQVELVGEMEKANLIQAVYKIEDLHSAINNVETFIPDLKKINYTPFYKKLGESFKVCE